jgi:DNA-binding NarL/FixJ family response regulator
LTSDGPPSNGRVIRCLIPDDQAMVREGFAAMLAAEPGIMIAGQAIDGADAVRQARRLDLDVVLMDVRMPVMDHPPAAVPQPSSLAALTPRETEVLRLVAEGLSNSEIAARLTVTDDTVRTHVSRLLAKLGPRDRVQAVVTAYESGLVVPARER